VRPHHPQRFYFVPSPVSATAIRFDTPSCVRLRGARNASARWPETVLLLKRLLQRHPRAPNERLFVSRYGEPLGPPGVRLKLAAYVKAAAAPASILRTKQVTPHSFRHGTTVHLVSAGADATVSGCCSSAHG